MLVSIMENFFFNLLLWSSFTSLLVVLLLLTVHIKIFFPLVNSGRYYSPIRCTLFTSFIRLKLPIILFLSVFLYRDVLLMNRKCTKSFLFSLIFSRARWEVRERCTRLSLSIFSFCIKILLFSRLHLFHFVAEICVFQIFLIRCC